MPIARAEVEVDSQHGPIVRVHLAGVSVAVYLLAESGVLTDNDGSQVGLEVTGEWHKLRSFYHPREERLKNEAETI